MERLDQSINIIEEEAKRLIDAVVKKMESVQDVVTTEKSTNEEFRKVCQDFIIFYMNICYQPIDENASPINIMSSISSMVHYCNLEGIAMSGVDILL
jgi:hypothetical protein